MTGKEIRALRGSLGLSAGALGSKLGVEAATVLAWEREELFPTKRALELLGALQGEARRHDESIRKSKDQKELRVNVQEYLQKLEESGYRRGLQEGLQRIREIEKAACQQGIQPLLHQWTRKLGRPLTDDERTLIWTRLDSLGPERLGDVILDLSAEALAAWLADPAAQ